MVEEPSDWRVDVTLDRGALAKDINTLVHILARQRVFCLVSASSQEEALEKAKAQLQRSLKTPMCYVNALNPRKLPT